MYFTAMRINSGLYAASMLISIMGSVLCDLGVAAIVVKDDSVLLVKESSGKYSGCWGLPKGYVNPSELPRDAALRELKEECAVDGVVVGLSAVRENLTDNGPAVFIAYEVTLNPNQIPKAASEVSHAEFVDKADFDQLKWVSEAMKMMAANAVLKQHNGTIDYSEIRGFPYLLHMPGGLQYE